MPIHDQLWDLNKNQEQESEHEREQVSGLSCAILLEVRPQDSAWGKVPQAPSLGFGSDLWYHSPAPNRIRTIPTLGSRSSRSIPRCQLKTWEEIHTGIQTPEHLAKATPAGLWMRRWPLLEPPATSPRQWPALPLLDTRPLCPLTYSTQMSKHALAQHMSLLPLSGLYFSNHVLKLNHGIVGKRTVLATHIRPGLIERRINRDKSYHR